MNFSLSESSLGRQRCRQWVPLITQQLRLRHVYQILALNLQSERRGSFYFTLHLTTMSSPFYTSETIESFSPKWPELDLKEINLSTSSIVIRVWLKCIENDKAILTWGVNFSGLVYIGSKIADVQPKYFERNTVIFFMHGGYFTSHYYIKMDLPKVVPFSKSLNLVDTLNDKVVYRRIAIKDHKNDIQHSYNLEKLRKLQSLQIQIKNRKFDVQIIKEKIQKQTCIEETLEEPQSTSNVSRYLPQLLTMNSLNKMLHEKPTKVQRLEMIKTSKQIEVAKFKMRLLVSERDKKYSTIRQLKQKHANLIDENDEKSSILMENYHHLSKESEKLKEYKRGLFQHREMYTHVHSQLIRRKRQLLQELLFIYPIKKSVDNKYTILDVHLPSSDILADCTDTGLSVALGYITHVLMMCAAFIQVPVRYPMTHYGSRSYITDHISMFLTERERDFPLFTRGKEKMQFTYAVYLLNKNLAQFRWLLGMNTGDLKATLPNLLSFLQGGREPRQENLPILSTKFDDTPKLVTLSNLPSSSANEPVFDFIRKENMRSMSPIRKPIKKSMKNCKNNECGKGLSEILAIPEAYLNRQISSDLLRSYVNSDRFTRESSDNCCNVNADLTSNKHPETTIKIKNGTTHAIQTVPVDSIEQGTDPLAPPVNVTSNITKSIKVHSDLHLRIKDDEYAIKQTRRISRSVGSYTDDESSFLRTSFELGSEPLLNVSNDDKPTIDGQQEFLEKWLENGSNIVSSSENLYPDEFLGSSLEVTSPLTARTDKLLSTKSFNLVKPK